MRAYFGLAAAVVLVVAGLAQAAPVDIKQISVDAKWGAHLDVDALMASNTLKKVRAQIIKDNPQAEAQLKAVCNLFRFDPTTDLHGITIYGTQLKKDTGVAIIHAKVDQKLLLDMVKANPGYQVTAYGKHEVHTWLKDGTKPQFAAFFKPDVIVFGASGNELKAALDVLDGTKPGVSGEGDPMPAGLILVARGRDLGEADLHAESPLSKQADKAELLVGENQGELFVRASLTIKDAAIAKHIKAVAEGAISLATLAKIDDADAMKLIGAVKVTQTDKSVTVDAKTPVDLVWTLLQKEIDKKRTAGK